jgi:hypothetical protein
MKVIKNFLRDRYHKLKRKYEVYWFNRYRKNYDSFSFAQKQKMASRWLEQYPEQAHFDTAPVKHWLENYVKRPCSVLEIGGWRGDLANKMLTDYNYIQSWHNYDLIEDNSYQKCHDLRYKLITLKDDLWHISLVYNYNALIATHMIEHINWREFIELAGWIPLNIETVLFEAPLPASEESLNWNGDYSSHVFEKGWEQVNAEMRKHGFRVEYTENNSVIYSR